MDKIMQKEMFDSKLNEAGPGKRHGIQDDLTRALDSPTKMGKSRQITELAEVRREGKIRTVVLSSGVTHEHVLRTCDKETVICHPRFRWDV